MSEQKTLEGQIAVVTGGSRGIGKSISLALADSGAHVVVNYARGADAANEVVKEIAAKGGTAEAAGFDVGNAESVDAAIKKVLADHGKIDIVVNNAGITSDSLLVRSKVEDWQRTIDVNLSGCFYLARAVGKAMMKARYGRIINISSVIGQTGNAGQAAYSASKAGVFGLTKSLARELAARGVTVNAIAPGYIETDMTDVLDEKVKEEIIKSVPLGRIGTSEDIAKCVEFLSDPKTSYITGQILAVNGGMYM